VPPEHTPPWQVSFVLHLSPSLQLVPFVAMGFEQRPVAGLQTPGTWHWSSAVQTIAVLTQTPPEHVPACGWQRSGDAHATPSAFWQLPVAPHALHAPHALLEQQKPSVQNAFATHSSLMVQRAPSGFLPHEVPTQLFGATHWELSLHVTEHPAVVGSHI
jgi:hypothetical protein